MDVSRARRLWPVLALILLALALLAPALWQGRLLAPADGLAQYFPERVVASWAYRAGEVPFWNPYIFSGMPLLAALQPGVLFPGNWPFLVFPAVAAMNLTVGLAFATAGLGTYAFGRAIGLGRPAATLAGMVYMLGGFMVAHLEHIVMIQVAGLLPWLLYAMERWRASLRGRHVALGAVAVALMILAGHPQTAAYGLLLAAAYGLFRLAGRDTGSRLRVALGFAAMAIAGLGLAAPQWLPSLDLIAGSQRLDLAFEALVDHSLPPRHLLTALFPFAFGAPPSGLFPVPYWGAGPWRNELAVYVGLGGLMLATSALATLKGSNQARFWAATALVGMVLALGEHTPFYRLWLLLPGTDAMRIPARHLLEFHLALAVLAGLGLERLYRYRRAAIAAWALWSAVLLAVLVALVLIGPALAERWQPWMPPGVDLASALTLGQAAFWLPAAFALALAAALALPPRARVAAWLLLVAADLVLVGWHQGWQQQSPLASTLGPLPQGLTFDAARTASVAAEPYPYFEPARVVALRMPATGALWGTRAVTGYDPLFPARYGALVGDMTHGGAVRDESLWSEAHHALDLLGVGTLRLDARLAATPAWRERLAGDRWQLQHRDDMVHLYTNRRALPMAFRPARVEVASDAAIASRLRGEAPFDPAREAFVAQPLASPPTPGAAAARFVSLNRLAVSTAGAGPGLVVVSEGYDPGWRAWLGDRALRVHRVDGVLLGIEVPAGDHDIELRYEPRLWRGGLAATALAAAALLLGLGLRRRRRRA